MKKKIMLFAGLLVSLSFCSNAQQFWIENWTGTACASLCTTYTGPNGTWTNVPTGLNGAAANTWFFSNTEQGMGRTVCGSGAGTRATAHIGNVSNSPSAFIFCPTGDCGAAYDASSGAPSVRSNQEIQSPVINCTGKSTITLSFNYIMTGQAAHDYATVYYYDGSTWAVLASPPKTVNTGCGGQGKWTYYSVGLPVSANNNPNVQIGFNWQNDTDNRGGDPSFAVDSIALSAVASPAPVTAFTVNDTLVCVGDSIQFTDQSTNSPTSWKWTFTGGNPPTSILQNQKVVYYTPGYYTVKLKSTNGGGSDSLSKTNYIHVVARPAITFSGKDSVCPCDSTTITASGGTSYLWAPGGQTTATITVYPCVTTCYSVSVSNGVCSTDSVFCVNIDPLPTNVTLDLTFTGKDLDTLCQSFQVYTLGGGSPAGGTYSGSHVQGPGGTQFLADSAGLYILTYTITNRAGCIATATDTVLVMICEGIQNISDNNVVSLYPNPANNTVNLQFNDELSGNATLEITDVTGRIIGSQVLNSFKGKEISINVSGIASGMYFIKITTDKSEYFAKFIKQ